MKAKELLSLCEETIKIIKEAGNLILKEASGKKVYFKREKDPVTSVDLAVEEFLKERLLKLLPEVAFLGEEGEKGEVSSSQWIVDPVDGTVNFMRSFPHYSISLALKLEGKIRLGVIYDPIRKEIFHGVEGEGVWLNREEIKVSPLSSLSQALLATGFSPRLEIQKRNLLYFEKFMEKSQALRRTGCASLDLAYVACGRLEGFWEIGLNPWDMAAGSLLVKLAGGKVTDLEGKNEYLEKGEILATNGKIHEEMLKVFLEG